MVVAVYWIKHLEHFSTVIVVNQTFIWLQLVFLEFIMLIPFWNTYITHFPDNVAIKVLLHKHGGGWPVFLHQSALRR